MAVDNQPTDLLAHIRERGQLRIGVSPDLPWMAAWLAESGRFEGAEVRLGRILSQALLGDEERAVFRGLGPDERIAALQGGLVDLVIAQLTITPEREQQVAFSVPYLTAREAILVLRESPFHSLEDLQGHCLAVPRGSASEQRYRRSQPSIRLVVTEQESGGVTLVRQGAVQGMANDSVNLQGLWESFPDPDTFRIVEGGESFADKPFGIALPLGQPALGAALNRELGALRRRGELDRIFAAVRPRTPI